MDKKAKRVPVQGKKKGKTTITAKAAGKNSTCKVTGEKKKKYMNFIKWAVCSMNGQLFYENY